jgi:predicted  nucleic acid-binding Zn-ribbon protein
MGHKNHEISILTDRANRLRDEIFQAGKKLNAMKANLSETESKLRSLGAMPPVEQIVEAVAAVVPVVVAPETKEPEDKQDTITKKTKRQKTTRR